MDLHQSRVEKVHPSFDLREEVRVSAGIPGGLSASGY
jgi:hypothetical protein